MRQLLLCLTVFFIQTISYGQKQGNIWYFADSAGVDFNGGVPVALTNGSIAFANHTDLTGNPKQYSEGTSAISDSSGNLLFYTDGQILWNRNHQVMPNGDSLFGNFSSTQSSIIVPQPGSSQFYYVFTVDDYWENQLKNGFRYSVVDICLDNGLGDIIQNKKNILLLDSVAEKVAAVKHANGVDYWIVTHKLYTDEFYSYKLTSNGITDTVITHIGAVHSFVQGQLKISPNGNRIALAAGQSYVPPCYFEVFDFDKTSGIVSNSISLTSPTNTTIYGVEFSPDNSKLYGTYGSPNPFGRGIIEFDLNAGNQTAINNSMTIVYQNTASLGIKGLQLGPDGKIYLGSMTGNGYLMAINFPNNYGISCGVQDNAIYLGGNVCSDGLPTFIAGYSYSNNTYNCTAGINKQNLPLKSLIFPNPFSTHTVLQTVNTFHSATLTVENCFGQTVALINNLSGRTVVIYRDNLPSGLYFVRLTENNKIIAINKIVITD